jgi:hypothetical protein
MTEWRTDGDKVRAVMHEEHEPPAELDYERLILLNAQGYEQADPAELEAARARQRQQVRHARGDSRSAWSADSDA